MWDGLESSYITALMMVTMLTNPNPLLSKVEWCRYCIHLRIINLNHFKMGIKITAPQPPSMASPPHHTSSKPTNRFQNYLGGGTQRHTQADKLVILYASISFLESLLKKNATFKL
jgi:hypothetical protein